MPNDTPFILGFTLTVSDRARLQEALDRCDFPYTERLPDRVFGVEKADLRAWKAAGLTWPPGHPDAGLIQLTDDWLAWNAPRVKWVGGVKTMTYRIQPSFLHETAHVVEFYYLDNARKQAIATAAGFDHWEPAASADTGALGHSHASAFVQAFSDMPLAYMTERWTAGQLAAIRSAYLD